MQFSTPHSQRLSATLKGKHFIVAFVIGLLQWQRPFHVVRLIIAIVVNAFERVFRGGAIAHVSTEILKRISPTRTHCYAPFTVVLKRFYVRVFGTRYDVRPNAIHLSTTIPMSPHPLSGSNLIPAPTTFGVTGSQSFATYDSEQTARALAQPASLTARRPDKSKNGQPVKYLSFNVNKFGMIGFRKKGNNDKVIVSHWGFTSLVKFYLVRLGDVLYARLRAVFILPHNREIIWQLTS
jgi:hypothetical protein